MANLDITKLSIEAQSDPDAADVLADYYEELGGCEWTSRTYRQKARKMRGEPLLQRPTPLIFKQLKLGDTFDFVDDWEPVNHERDRYVRTGARAYAKVTNPPARERNKVGSINVEVFHVRRRGRPVITARYHKRRLY